jgi:hypothetical protein
MAQGEANICDHELEFYALGSRAGQQGVFLPKGPSQMLDAGSRCRKGAGFARFTDGVLCRYCVPDGLASELGLAG